MSADVDTLKDQMMDLQSQLAFQEDTLQSLNDTMALQQQEILLLRRQLELLRQHQLEQSTRSDTAVAGKSVEEKPPHY